MKRQSKPNRPAVAMIELIFAIVVIGFVLISAPNLISTATKSGYVAIQQEAINEAASQVNMILGYHWDENSADERFIDPILKVTSGNSDFNEVNTTNRRLGTPPESYRTFARADGAILNASSLGPDSGDRDDIDDFSGNSYLLEIEESDADYIEKDTIKISTTIDYGQDTSPFTTASGTTNIKTITTTVTSTSGLEELDKTITLKAFSCNIGGYSLEERDF
jgi:hypothetical protein